MAAPHISGLGLLYLGVHPTAAPAEIKSAMMTTAYVTKNAAGAPVTDPFTQGAGHVDPTKYFAPGLLYLHGLDDWYEYIQGIGYDVGVVPIDASNLKLASIAIGSLTGSQSVTRTVTSTRAATFTAAANVSGIDAVVSPSTLTFGAAGKSKSYTVTFTRTIAPLDAFTTGSLTWTSGMTAVRSPMAVRSVTLVASASGTGSYGSVDITVTPGAWIRGGMAIFHSPQRVLPRKDYSPNRQWAERRKSVRRRRESGGLRIRGRTSAGHVHAMISLRMRCSRTDRFDAVAAHEHPEIVDLAVCVELACPVKERGHCSGGSSAVARAVASPVISARPVRTPLIVARMPKAMPTMG